MHSYQELLHDILDNGEGHSDRTGVGTRSVFGRQWRHSMELGFPLLTTKRVPLRWVAEELFWFLSGSTNEGDLRARGVDIWKEWAGEDGELGPIYGRQWRNQETVRVVKRRHFPRPDLQEIDIPDGMENSQSYQRSFCGVACMGSIMGTPGGVKHPLLETWKGMIQRCYYPGHQAYSNYGGAGVWVCDRWLVFSNFVEDFQKIEGWELKAEYPDEYTLDKDCSGANVYSVATCAWISKKEQSINVSGMAAYRGIAPDGTEHVFASANSFAKENRLKKQSILNCVHGRQSQHLGWTFERCDPPEGHSLVYRRVDQLRILFAQLRRSPNSRRLVVSAWNPMEVGSMSLAPCHTLWQCKVHADDSLSLHLYARSIDSFLGLPFNIASYALLLSLIAECTARRPRDLVISFGDLHLYANHFDQAQEQIKRTPRGLPWVHFHPRLRGSGLDGLLSCTWDDVYLEDYHPLAKIEAPVAV